MPRTRKNAQIAVRPDSSIKDRLRVRLEHYSGQRRKAAEYFLARPREVAVYSLRKVAGRARVSPGTLVTLGKSLGFGSYNAFRSRVQQEEMGVLDYFSAGARALQDDKSPKQRITPGSLIEKVIRSDMKNIGELAGDAQIGQLTIAAEAIQDAKRVYAVGRRASFGVMHYFYYVAQLVRDDVHLLDGAGDMSADRISDLGPNDVVICCGFYPYIRSVAEIVAEAENRGARIIAITDSRGSPLAGRNSIVITLPTESPWIFGSTTGALVVVQALVAQLTALGGEAVLERIKQRERMLAKLNIHMI